MLHFLQIIKSLFSFLKPSAVNKSAHEDELQDLKDNLQDSPPAGPLVKLCKTYDQARAVAQFVETLAEREVK